MLCKDFCDELCKCESDRCAKTIQTYGYSLAWLARRIDGFSKDSLPEPADVIDYLNEHKIKPRRKQCSYCAMKVLHNARGQPDKSHEYSQALIDVKRTIDKEYFAQERNEKQQKNWVEFTDLKREAAELRKFALSLDKFKLWTKAEYAKAQLAFILAFHLKYPIRRELASVQYGSDIDTSKGNVLMEKARKIVFREHKVKKHHPVFEMILDRNQWRLLQLLRRQHRHRGITSGTILLNTYWRPMTGNAFTMWMKREMGKLESCKGKAVSCLCIRHSVITHQRRNDSSLKNRKAFADRCMHSMNQNDMYRIH